jgi:hypothetical protein
MVYGSYRLRLDRRVLQEDGQLHRLLDTADPYGQTGLPLSLLVQGEDANTMFDVSQPIDGPGADIKGIKRTNNIDFQAHVSVRPGVRLIAEGINLTNQAIRQFASIDYDRPKVYTTAGRTFTFGVSAEF